MHVIWVGKILVAIFYMLVKSASQIITEYIYIYPIYNKNIYTYILILIITSAFS